MDGENNGKPYFLMDDLGGFHPQFLETSIYVLGLGVPRRVFGVPQAVLDDIWLVGGSRAISPTAEGGAMKKELPGFAGKPGRVINYTWGYTPVN